MPMGYTLIDDNNNAVSVTDGKLNVNGTFSPDQTKDEFTDWIYKIDSSKSDINITTSDTSIKSITNEGIIDFIMVNFSTSNIEFILDIDGTERLRIELDDLKDENEYNMEEKEIHLLPILVKKSGKQIIFKPSHPIYFSTSFGIKAKSISGTKTMKAYFIEWRDKA